MLGTELNKYVALLSEPTIRILPVFKSFLVLNQSVVRLSAHGLGQVTECLWVIKVQFLCTHYG